MSNLVKDISAKDFEKEVLQSELPILVDFWAPWCQPCLMMIPALNQVAERVSGKGFVAKVNVNEAINRDLSIKYDIQSIPNMKIFHKGKVVEEFIGVRDAGTLRQALEKYAG